MCVLCSVVLVNYKMHFSKAQKLLHVVIKTITVCVMCGKEKAKMGGDGGGVPA